MTRMRRKTYGGSVSVNVDVDVDVNEILDEIEDDTLIEELRLRGKSPDAMNYERDYAERALSELLAGRSAAAIALLERALFQTVPSKPDVPANLQRFL